MDIQHKRNQFNMGNKKKFCLGVITYAQNYSENLKVRTLCAGGSSHSIHIIWK